MTQNENSPADLRDVAALAASSHRNPLREHFDGEVHLPETISKEFLSAALLWAIENKVEFGVFHEPKKIVIAFFGGDEQYLPSRWSDKRWHIGLEDSDPDFLSDDG
jgi:hypothetical protein